MKNLKNPKEKMRMNIEFADNGIIIRNPDCEDEITLALQGRAERTGDYDYHFDHSDEYKKIGRKIYGWLFDVVLPEHASELLITNFDLEIVATCKGRNV